MVEKNSVLWYIPIIFNEVGCCDTIEAYGTVPNSDIAFFAYGTWTKQADQVNGKDAFVNGDTGIFWCLDNWLVYESGEMGDPCPWSYIYMKAETSCPNTETQWHWSYWDGDLGQGFAVKCAG